MKPKFCIGIFLSLFLFISLYMLSYIEISQACHDEAACPHNLKRGRIGISLPLSGPLNRIGTSMRLGYEFWIKEVNDRGGIKGNEIIPLILDDNGSLDRINHNFKLFTEIEHVDVIFGPPFNGVLPIALPIANEAQYPIIFPSLSSEEEFQKFSQSKEYPYGFMLLSPIEKYIETAGEAARTLGISNLALLVEQGFPLPNGLKNLIKSKNLNLIMMDEFPRNNTDFSPYITKLASVNPEAIFFLNNSMDSAVYFTKELRQRLSQVKMTLVNYTGNNYYKESLGDLVEGIITRASWNENLPTPNNKRFVEGFKKEYNELPTENSASAYAIGEIYEKALFEVFNSTKKTYLHNVIRKLNTSSILGAFKVKAFGIQEGHKHLLIQFQNGKEQIVWPVEYATAKLQ